ncbi:polysaccharide deacetylase family protein [Paenibacillus rhizoplanae]
MIWEVRTSQKVIALTFDDGPDPLETDSILEVLHEYQAKCTFFCNWQADRRLSRCSQTRD